MEVTKIKQPKKLGTYAVLISFLINLVLFLLIAVSGKFVFVINDDKNMLDAISGKFLNHSTSYGVFISQLICYPLKVLYSINCNIPFYGIFMCMVLFASCWIICYYFINFKNKKNFLISSLAYVITFFCLFFYNIMNVQFTLVAVFPMLACLFMVGSKENLKPINFVLIGLLIVTSFAIRDSICLFALPFLVACLIFKCCKNKKLLLKNLLIVLAITSSAVAINKLADAIVYNNNVEYANYIEYNKVRNELLDYYEVPDYLEAKSLYDSLNIDEDSVLLLKKHYMLDLEEFSLQNLKQIRDYQSQHIVVGQRFLLRAKSVVKVYFKQQGQSLVFLLLTSLLLIVFAKEKLKTFVFVLLLMLIMFILSFAMAFIMKFPSRIANVLLLLTIALLLNYQKDKQYVVPNKKLLILPVLFYACLIPFPINSSFGQNNYVNKCNAEKFAIENLIKEDYSHIYFVDNNLITRQTAELFNQSSKIENMYYCTWYSRSPYAQELLGNLGYRSLNDLFKNAQNVKIIADKEKGVDPLINYINKKYGRNLVKQEEQNFYVIYALI